MNWQRYLRNLRQRHRRAVSQTIGPGPLDYRLNLVLATACALAALLLVATGGYRAGFESVHDIGRHMPASLLQALSCAGDTLLAICLIAWFAYRRPHVVWMAVLASAYAATLTLGLKYGIHADRPHVALAQALAVIGPELHLQSFPSGHTATAFVAAACLSVGAPFIVRPLLLSLAFAVGASRVWVGAHWPVDVLAGAAIAGLSVALAVRTIKATSWGLGLTPHLSIVALVALCALAELIRAPAYPLALPLTTAVALLSLFMLAKDYVAGPLLASADAIGSPES